MQSKENKMDSSELRGVLQHMKFKEAVGQWRKTKKGKIQIIREDATTKTKNRCSCPYHRKNVFRIRHERNYTQIQCDDKVYICCKKSIVQSLKRMADA